MTAPKKNVSLPPRILIYGTPKIGKSSFGAMADRPVFLPTEDGLDALDVESFPKAESFEEVMQNITWLCENDHNYGTLVTDSLDWLEPLIWKQICHESGVASIELANGGYGKGYVAALNLWREFYDATNWLRQEKGMTIISIAHASVKRFESPVTDAYDRYEIKLHKAAAALAQEQADIILFANYFVGIKKEADASKQKDDDKRKRGIGSGERILHTEERPAYIAGNRYSLPAEIQFDKAGEYWSIIAQCVPFFSKQALIVSETESETSEAETEAAVKKTSKKK